MRRKKRREGLRIVKHCILCKKNDEETKAFDCDCNHYYEWECAITKHTYKRERESERDIDKHL